MSNPIRIMVVDDSAIMRRLIRTALSTDKELQVVCEAKHGMDALEQLDAARPDIVVMDVEMPVMDGVDAAREIRKRSPKLPIIMFSSLTSRGAEATLDAIAAGANDFATKPAGAGHIDAAMKHVQGDLIPKIHQWAGRIKPVVEQSHSVVAPVVAPVVPRRATTTNGTSGSKIAAIAIGVSTGGPDALTKVISRIPEGFTVPILIAQHMPPVFTGLLAERLTANSCHKVREAAHGDDVRPGTILIAPGDFHMTVRRDQTHVRACLDQEAPENSCRPSVDPLFRSVADCYGHQTLGIVLTGMGKDGTAGAGAIKSRGGRVFVQDQETSVVWGMPGQVAGAGLADRILPLDQIGPEVIRAVNSVPRKAAAAACV